MALNAETLRGGGPGVPARSLVVSAARTARRIIFDRWASRLVVLGGIIIIMSILAILLVIVGEVWPLFRPAAYAFLGTRPASTPGRVAAGGESIGVDEYREIAFEIARDGSVRFVALTDRPAPPPVPVPGMDGATVASVTASAAGAHLIGTSDGRGIPVEVTFETEFADGRRTVVPRPVFGTPTTLDTEKKRAVRRAAFATTGSGPVTVAQVAPTELVVQSVVEKKALIGEARREESLQTLAVPVDGEITALQLDSRAEDLYVGTSSGQLVHYDLRERNTPRIVEMLAVNAAPTPVTALGFLIGDRTLVVGDGAGRVSTWQSIPRAGSDERRLTRIHDFSPHEAAVVAIAASRRDKGFATADAAGGIHVSYGTTGALLLRLTTAASPVQALVFAPKADGILTTDTAGAISHWRIDNPHPEITLGTLFQKVWYEGYPQPEYVWQSTGGTDDFEAKLSLTPLLYGTLKGTFYALLIAIPVALLAALSVSEFMHPAVKGYVKPVVEIMAALPSVVLGFLAGLWLAPMIERIVPGLFLLPLVASVGILAVLLAWRGLPLRVRAVFRPGTEVFLLVPIVLMAGWAAFTLGGFVEARLLGGDYRGWLLSALGLTYDQRNSLVVGIAMGFAVIPIIFTIAEDSLANVPQHLRAGSLALGATRWQTALRIVVPTASPGIFSAIMIGFGRAVGETMIVLMATGNTPVMDWNIFSGFRALSANIAVELPEAPEGGTLFRVLFLAAFLLFCLTFLVNTVAELVRLRLRRKYRYL
jgi:phosphate transport system permease protein